MLGNWIIQTTTTTGAGDITLSNTAGYPGVSSQFAVGEAVAYAILDDTTGAPLERGLGYLSSGTVLVRAKPMATMSGSTYNGVGPSAVTLAAGTKRVIITPAAQSTLTAAPGVWGPQKGYGDTGVAGGAGTLATVADRAYAIPFRAAVDSDIDALIVNVTTAGTAASAKVAIFSMGLDGLPGVKLAESGVIDCTSTGNKVGTFTRMRPPNAFFACLLTDVAVTFRAYSAGVNNNASMGFDNAMVPIAYIHHVGATGLNFPSVWTPVANGSNTTRPCLVARCVS